MEKLSFHTNDISIRVGEMGGTIRGGISRIDDPATKSIPEIDWYNDVIWPINQGGRQDQNFQ